MTLSFLGHVTSSVTWPFDSQVVISYRYSIGTKSVSLTIVEIMGPKYIGVMTLTFLGHVTSSVTWLFESQWAIGGPLDPSLYLQPFSRYLALSILRSIDLIDQSQTNRPFLGHVTSSVTWPFESQWVISYWWSIGPKSLSPAVFEILCPKHHVPIPIGTMLNRHIAISRDMYPLYRI